MKKLIAVVIVAALAWSGYWWIRSTAIARTFDARIAEARAEGWDIAYSDRTIGGFPNRVDLRLADIAIAPPSGDWRWEAPFLQVFSLVYNPRHLIVALPDTHALTLDGTDYAIAGTGQRMSVNADAARLIRAIAEADTLQIEGPERRIALGRVNAALEATDVEADLYRLAASAVPTAPEGTLAALQSELRFTVPPAFGAPMPGIATLDLRDLRYETPDMLIQADGALEVDEAGRAHGEIALAAENWRTALDAADLPPDLAGLVRNAITLVSGLSGGGDALDLTLAVDAGRVSLGPLPLGRLPAFPTGAAGGG